MTPYLFAPQRSVSRRALFSTFVLFPAVRILARGGTQQSPTFSTDVRVVNVFATVRDKDGKVVRDLAKEDFSLLEDGRPQTIQYFSRQSDLPLTLGLLVDTSMSERRMLGTERDASYSFLEKVLRPGSDKAFLIHFDHDVELLQDLTSSRERLEKALALLDRPSWKDDNGSQGGGNGGGNPSGNWGGRWTRRIWPAPRRFSRRRYRFL
ncbi:MAG: VWA domain-containing protein [Acidobacteriaceae bacterium]|nr:VWA domain-containing protein [Acidobacteriaceae bacterium]